MAEACGEGVKSECKKVKVVPEQTWNGVLLRRAKGIFRVLKAREKAKLAAFVKANAKTIAKLNGLTKQAALAAYQLDVIEAKFSDAKNGLYVAASKAGVVSHEYEKRPATRVERPTVEPYVFDPGNQVYDPAKQGNLVRFLSQSKHREYQDLLAEYEDMRVSIELADLPTALAAIRSFRDVAPPQA